MCVKATYLSSASLEALTILLISLFVIVSLPGCDSDRMGVIDPSFNTPYLEAFSLSPQEIITDTILVNGDISPTDTIPIEWDAAVEIEPRGVKNLIVHYRMTGTLSASSLMDVYIPLNNTGTEESIHVSDRIGTNLQRSEAGMFTVTATIITDDGLSSNKLSKPVNIIRTNHPPEILHIDAPDTLVVTGTVNFEITVYVDDPDGVDDVVSVHFMYTNPDGIQNPDPIPLNKIEPGIFRSGFSFNETNTKGTHTLEFQAFDRIGAGSEIYVHTIEIL